MWFVGFVEFATIEDKEKALKKDKTSMGRHVLAVKSVNKQDMIERMRNARFINAGPGQPPPNNQGPPPQQQQQQQQHPDSPGMKPIPPGVLNRNWTYIRYEQVLSPLSISLALSHNQGPPPPQQLQQHPDSPGMKPIPPGVLNRNWTYIR